MSLRRIVGITTFGILFIAAVIGVMLLTSYLRRNNEAISLPVTPVSTEPWGETEPDVPDRVEVTTENIRVVVSTLSRPDEYSRDVLITTYWDTGWAEYFITVTVSDGMTSLSMSPPTGPEKRIIVTADTLYIWYKGDTAPYTGSVSGTGDGYRTADEWQMLITYEDLLALDPDDIIEAQYIEYNGEDCIYAGYRSPLLGYTKTFYISLELGLITGAEEYDETGMLVYRMTAGACTFGETDPADFTLPDGTILSQ